MDNVVRIAVVGAGALAGEHVAAYSTLPNAKVTAVCDVNRQRAQQMADRFGIEGVFTDYNEMFASGVADAAVVVTWNNTHAEITIAALNAGLHVLCEKPPAMNAAQATEMLEAAKKNGKLLMYGLVRRFLPYTRAVKDYVQGELGNIYFAKAAYLRRFGNPGGWFAQKALSGGGPLIDLGVHIIDAAIYIMGKPKAVSVYGAVYSEIGVRKTAAGYEKYQSADGEAVKCDVEDFATAMIKFENGASLFVETSWDLNLKADVQNIELFGSRAGARVFPSLETYGDNKGYLTDTAPIMPAIKGGGPGAHFVPEASHFIDCVANGAECIAPAEDGVEIMRILDGIYESSRTNSLITL